MKKRRGKRIVAYIIAFLMIFGMGMTELSPIAEAAQYTILETDVSAPSTGCTMFGVYGTYYVDAQNALDRINEIRKEACTAGKRQQPQIDIIGLCANQMVDRSGADCKNPCGGRWIVFRICGKWT